MRILILVAATFAAGLLAGTLVWTGDEAPQRRGTGAGANGSGSGYPVDRGSPTSWRGRGGEAGAGGGPSGGASELPSGDVGELAREAAGEIEKLVTSDRAAAILEDADGQITGTVRDSAGDPVEGVVVTAIPETQPFGLATAARRNREKPHVDRDLSDVAGEAIQRELWRREARRTARTGIDGRYSIVGLIDSRHTLTAYHEQYSVSPLAGKGNGKVVPDAVVDFLAQPVRLVRVEVRDPEGSVVENAWLSWKGPHGNGWDPWTEEENRIRMPVGVVRVKAQVWAPVPMQSAEVEHTVVEGNAETPLVLTLEGRRILTARLAMPEEFVAPGGVDYRLRLLLGGEQVEPESLLKDNSQPRGRSRSAGRAQWYDLEPGRYLVAAFLNKRRLIGSGEVELVDGEVEVELEVEEPADADCLKVRLVGPDGGQVPGDASFRIITSPDKKPRYQSVDSLARADGIRLLLLEGVDTRGSDEATLRVGTREYGSVLEDFRFSSAGTITVKMGKPSRVSLQVDGVPGSGLEGKLHVALLAEHGAAAWKKVGSNGSCELGAVQPGEYGLQLLLKSGGATWPIWHQQVRLDEGEDERSLRVPPLHTLRVRVEGRTRSRTVSLRSKDPALGGRFKRDGRHNKRVAVFGGLAAGSYEVSCGRKRATVRVPGPAEIVLQ